MKKYPTRLYSTSHISSKYQTVIPQQIRKQLDLAINEELFWHVVTHNAQPVIVVTPKPKQWASYLSGLGKDVWKDVQTDTYLAELKKEWRR